MFWGLLVSDLHSNRNQTVDPHQQQQKQAKLNPQIRNWAAFTHSFSSAASPGKLLNEEPKTQADPDRLVGDFNYLMKINKQAVCGHMPPRQSSIKLNKFCSRRWKSLQTKLQDMQKTQPSFISILYLKFCCKLLEKKHKLSAAWLNRTEASFSSSMYTLFACRLHAASCSSTGMQLFGGALVTAAVFFNISRWFSETENLHVNHCSAWESVCFLQNQS